MYKDLTFAVEEWNKAFKACFKGIKKKRGFRLSDVDHFFPLDYKELWRRRLWNIHKEEEELKAQVQTKEVYEKLKLANESQVQKPLPLNVEQLEQ